jgi:hypothetical protein
MSAVQDRKFRIRPSFGQRAALLVNGTLYCWSQDWITESDLAAQLAPVRQTRLQ